jgi:hypothetical protein
MSQEHGPSLTFDQNLLRVVAAELELLTMMVAAPATYGTDFWKLSQEQRGALLSTVAAQIGSIAHTITPELLDAIGLARKDSIGAPISWTPQ